MPFDSKDIDEIVQSDKADANCSCLFSGTKSNINPDPPAPRSLPPIAPDSIAPVGIAGGTVCEARDVCFRKSGARDPRIVGEGHNKDFGTG